MPRSRLVHRRSSGVVAAGEVLGAPTAVARSFAMAGGAEGGSSTRIAPGGSADDVLSDSVALRPEPFGALAFSVSRVVTEAVLAGSFSSGHSKSAANVAF